MTATGERILAKLTPRERTVSTLACEGLSNRDISERIGTTEQAVKNYFRSIYEKSGAETRTQLLIERCR